MESLAGVRYEGPNEGGVFDPRGRFYTARRIHRLRPDGTNRCRDILGLQAARKHKRELAPSIAMLGNCLPISGLPGATECGERRSVDKDSG